MTDSPNGNTASVPDTGRDNGIEAHGLVRELKAGSRRSTGSTSRSARRDLRLPRPNGAGKSTTSTCSQLCCRRPPAAPGRRPRRATEGALVRDAIGAALQEAALDPQLSANEHIRLQGALHG